MYTEQEYFEVAKNYDVPVPSLKAIIEVEASGEGFLPDGRPKILFEAHYFRKRTDAQYDVSHPTISAPYPASRKLYKGGEAEYVRLELAKSLNENAAIESASWGAGQVMGAEWKPFGFATPQAFVAHAKTAAGQMDLMMRFCKTYGLLDEMRRFPDMDACKAFGARYNGDGETYGPKIKDAFLKHSGKGSPRTLLLRKGDKGDAVQQLQRALGITPDGDFGPQTEKAVKLFQADHGLDVDGVVGRQTRTALGLA